MLNKNRTRNFILFWAVLFLPISFYAQNSSSYGEEKNHLSLDPFLPIFGTYQVQYERTIGNRISLGLSVGYKGSSGIFEVASIDFPRFTSEPLNFKGIKLIPEFRWYVQKSHTGLNGFYVGAFFKYQKYKNELAGDYVSIDEAVSPILIDVDARSLISGIEVGYKLSVGKNFFLDFIIAGPGISFNTLELHEVNPVPDAFYDDLTEALKDFGIIDVIDPDFEINGNQKTKVTLPAFRYGMKFGYSF